MVNKKHNLKFALSIAALLTVLGCFIWLSAIGTDSIHGNSDDIVSNTSQSETSPFRTISNVQSNRTQAANAKRPTQTSQSTVSLKEVYSRSAKGVRFETPTLDDVRAFETLLSNSIVNDFTGDNLNSEWQRLGWNLHCDQSNGWIIIEEAAHDRRGRGLYVIRISKVSDSVMVQAPHRFFDMHTGTITRKLFEKHPIKAAAWNSVHRKQYDIAHESRNFFNAFTRVLTEAQPEIVNIQIHGFDTSKRKGFSKEDPETLAIVSNATRYPDQRTKDFATGLKREFGKEKVWLFPQETSELGATTNQQASVMRSQGSSNFLHLEMSKPMRESLLKSADDRETLYKVFKTVGEK